MIGLYFLCGAFLYFGMALKGYELFEEITFTGFIRGFVLGYLLWPLGIVVQLYLIFRERQSTKNLPDSELEELREIVRIVEQSLDRRYYVFTVSAQIAAVRLKYASRRRWKKGGSNEHS